MIDRFAPISFGPVPRAARLGLVLAACLAPAAHAAELTVRTLSGEALRPSALRLAGDDLVLQVGRPEGAGTGERVVPLADVVVLDVSGPRNAASGFRDDVSVRLADGSLFAGQLVAGAEDQLALRQADLGVLKIPLDLVRGLAFGPASERREPPSAAPKDLADRVTRSGAAEGDVLSGTVTRIDADGVVIESDLGTVRLAPPEVATVAIAAEPQPARDEGREVAVELASGGTLKGRLRGLDAGSVTVSSVLGGDRTLSIDDVARVRLASDRFAYLSDLEPAQVEQTPYFGGDDAFLFPWRRDRSVTGRPLSIAGERFGKGLGLHARTRLTYALEGAYVRFEAAVGIADEVLDLNTRGAAVVRIVIDGATRFESPMLHAGDPVLRVPSIDVTGAKTLLVVADFGDRADLGDRVVIGDPILVRAP